MKKLSPRKLGAIEITAEVVPMAIGEKNERPSLTRMILAADSATGMVFPPDVSKAEDDPTESVLKALTNAFLARGAYPSEVRHRGSFTAIKPFLDALGIASRVTKKLPACDNAFAGMRQFGVF